MKKKLISMLLAGTMVLSLAACGGGSADGGDAGDGEDAGAAEMGTSDDENTLTVAAWDPNFNIPALEAAELLKNMRNGEDLKANYKENVNPDFVLDIKEQSGSSDVETAITTAASSGKYENLPDMVLFQDHWIQKYVADYPDAWQNVDDIDINSLRSYRIEFEHRNPEHVWNGDDDQTFLKNMGGYAIDRSTEKEWLTTAGLLMFGKGIAVRERFDNVRMDYIDESNLLPGSRWSDRLTYDGMWENNLYNFIRQVMPRLVSNLKRPFRLDGMIRIDDTPVHKAIREAVVNMIIHSDYLITGVLKILKMDNGFTFSNPGNLKLPVSTIYEGGHSVARNPRIQTMFRMIGYGDNIGSGFPTILSAWGEENWRKPDLSTNEELHQVELKLWMISLMPQECTDHLQNLIGVEYTNLSSNEQIILGTAYLEGTVTNSRLQSMLDLHSTEVGHILSGLVDKKMLIADKKGRWTSYQLNGSYESQMDQVRLEESLPPAASLKNNTDRIIYDFIRTNGFITTHQIVEITTITTPQGASVALKRLINANLVQKVRQGRQVIYQLKK